MFMSRDPLQRPLTFLRQSGARARIENTPGAFRTGSRPVRRHAQAPHFSMGRMQRREGGLHALHILRLTKARSVIRFCRPSRSSEWRRLAAGRGPITDFFYVVVATS